MKALLKPVLGAVLAVGLGAGLVNAAEVNVYSSRHYKGDQEVFARFAKSTGIKINVVEGDINGLIQRLKREGNASPADLMITVDAGNLWRLKTEGLTQPVSTPALTDAVPANLRDPGGNWYAITTRARIFAYHADRVKPADLTSYEALAEARWKGKVLIRSSNNIYNQSLLASMIAVHGAEKTESWAKGLVGNFARTPQGGDTDQLKALLAGEGDVAVVNTYYLARLKDGSPEDRKAAEKILPFFPNQADRGTHINVSGVALARFAPNKAEAVKLMEYLLDVDAQKLLAEGNYEFPVRRDVAVHPLLASWGAFKADALNVAVLGENNPEAVRLADRAGWR